MFRILFRLLCLGLALAAFSGCTPMGLEYHSWSSMTGPSDPRLIDKISNGVDLGIVDGLSGIAGKPSHMDVQENHGETEVHNQENSPAAQYNVLHIQRHSDQSLHAVWNNGLCASYSQCQGSSYGIGY